jgi:hypothetical protein
MGEYGGCGSLRGRDDESEEWGSKLVGVVAEV